MLTYGSGNGWLAGHPAAIRTRFGRGSVAYLGAVLDPALMDAAARAWAEDAGLGSPILAVPAGVEVCRRSGVGREILILINHGKAGADFGLPAAMDDLLAGGRTSRCSLAPHGVAVLSRPAR